MKKIFLYPISAILFSVNLTLQAQTSGKDIFDNVCSACHTIGMGRKVGPDLSKVYEIRKNEWLVKFIRSSQKFIKSGDTAAIAIYNEYSKIPMPDNQYTDEQILGVIDYIRLTDKNATTAVKGPTGKDTLTTASMASKAQADSLARLYTPENSAKGRSLFYGHTRFTNRASPCFVCHKVNDQAVLGGGKLAIDLTGAYIKLGPTGIQAILSNPPFPAMKTAIGNRTLTEAEKQEIISMLKAVGEQKYAPVIPDSAGLFFLLIGFVCALVVLAHLYIFYDNRNIT